MTKMVTPKLRTVLICLVDGAAVGLLRLQDTYHLKTSDLANGYVEDEYTGKQLTADDCFEIGKAAYNVRDYFHSLEWMLETEARMKIDPSSKVKRADVLEYMAYALFQQGNTKRALVLTQELVELDPYHPRATGNIEWYSERLTDEELDSLHELPPIKNIRNLKYDIEERERYEKLCRGEFKSDPVMESKLYCYYKKDNPFLRIAPFKVEILRFDPLVVLFKEVVHDSEVSYVLMTKFNSILDCCY